MPRLPALRPPLSLAQKPLSLGEQALSPLLALVDLGKQLPGEGRVSFSFLTLREFIAAEKRLSELAARIQMRKDENPQLRRVA